MYRVALQMLLRQHNCVRRRAMHLYTPPSLVPLVERHGGVHVLILGAQRDEPADF